MTNELFPLDYERLADLELNAASKANDNEVRAGHLNQAAIYATLSEKSRALSKRSVEVMTLITALSATLADADRLKLSTATMHINSAILDLGGPGISPPDQLLDEEQGA